MIFASFFFFRFWNTFLSLNAFLLCRNSMYVHICTYAEPPVAQDGNHSSRNRVVLRFPCVLCERAIFPFPHSIHSVPSIKGQKKCVLLHITLAMVFDLPLFKGETLHIAGPSGPAELIYSQDFPKISHVVKLHVLSCNANVYNPLKSAASLWHFIFIVRKKYWQIVAQSILTDKSILSKFV